MPVMDCNPFLSKVTVRQAHSTTKSSLFNDSRLNMEHMNSWDERYDVESDGISGEDESENKSADEDKSIDFQEKLRPGTICLGLYEDYVPKWKPRHGWREFYQNWNDAIKESNNLGSRAFLKKPIPDKKYTIFHAIHPDTAQVLGFIRFSESGGTVELVNYNSWLSGKSLGLGYTSKYQKSHLAGTHGEGYKLACLAMVRNGYNMKFEASSVQWDFNIPGPNKRNEGYLCCSIKKIDKKIDKHKMRLAKQGIPSRSRQVQAKARAWADVYVKIGGGEKTRVTEAQFKEWTQQSLDLDPPLTEIQTEKGSIILGESFSNRVYLKGLLLERRPSAKSFKFGYNLTEGAVNRDREALADPEEQGRILAEIWAAAIKKDSAATLTDYFEMLQHDEKWADVQCAIDNISEETAKILRQHLRDQDSEDKDFYYDRKAGSKDIELIVKSLKKEPVPLSAPIWVSLRRYNLLRTPDEQRHHLLFNAPNSAYELTAYSTGVLRTLKAILALDQRTKDLEIFFKDGEYAELDLLLDRSRLLINDKWLDFDASHALSFCALFAEANDDEVKIDTFSCNHVVTELYNLILVELSRDSSSELGIPPDTDNSLHQKVSEKIRQIPHKVDCKPGNSAGVIHVSWVHSESEKDWKLHGVSRHGRVILHRENTCRDEKFEFLANNIDCESECRAAEPAAVGCGCPQKAVLLKDGEVEFDGLDTEQEYFPMVSAAGSQAIYGQPPPPLRPSQPGVQRSHNHRSSIRYASLPGAAQKADMPENDNDIDLYDVSDDEDTDGGIEVDTSRPIRAPSTNRSTIRNVYENGVAKQVTQSESEHTPQADSQLEKLQTELDAALSNKRQLEAQLAQLQSTNAEFHTLREELDAVTKKHQTLEAQFVDIHDSGAELELVTSQLLEAVEANKRLQAEVSQLTLREAELSKDLTEKPRTHEQLPTHISDNSDADPQQARELQNSRVSPSAVSDLQDKIAALEAENKDLDERADMALEFQKEAESECAKAHEKNKKRKEIITDFEKRLETANSRIQFLLANCDQMRAALQLKDAEIRQVTERLNGINQKAPTIDEARSVEHEDEMRRKDIKIKGLLEENDILMTKVREAREQCETIASTLDIVFGVVKRLLNLNPRTQIRAPLQSVAAMIQGVSNLGNEGSGAKRLSDDTAEARQAKKIRIQDAIEVDE